MTLSHFDTFQFFRNAFDTFQSSIHLQESSLSQTGCLLLLLLQVLRRTLFSPDIDLGMRGSLGGSFFLLFLPCYLTKHFTGLEPQITSINGSEWHKMCWPIEFQALNLENVRSGRKRVRLENFSPVLLFFFAFLSSLLYSKIFLV